MDTGEINKENSPSSGAQVDALTSVSDLLKNSFDTHDRYIKKILHFSVPFFVAIFILNIPDLFFLGDKEDARSLLIGFAFALCSSLVILVFQLMMLLFLKNPDQYQDRASLVADAKKNIAGFTWVSFMVFAYIIVWFFMLIIPAIIMSIYYSFAIWAFIYEGLNGGEALKRSRELVKGYWWAVAWRFFVLSLIALIFYVGVNIISFGYLSWILDVLLPPFTLIYSGYIYRDLVKIKNVGIAVK